MRRCTETIGRGRRPVLAARSEALGLLQVFLDTPPSLDLESKLNKGEKNPNEDESPQDRNEEVRDTKLTHASPIIRLRD